MCGYCKFRQHEFHISEQELKYAKKYITSKLNWVCESISAMEKAGLIDGRLASSGFNPNFDKFHISDDNYYYFKFYMHAQSGDGRPPIPAPDKKIVDLIQWLECYFEKKKCLPQHKNNPYHTKLSFWRKPSDDNRLNEICFDFAKFMSDPLIEELDYWNINTRCESIGKYDEIYKKIAEGWVNNPNATHNTLIMSSKNSILTVKQDCLISDYNCNRGIWNPFVYWRELYTDRRARQTRVIENVVSQTEMISLSPYITIYLDYE